jgi:hypothetical protein
MTKHSRILGAILLLLLCGGCLGNCGSQLIDALFSPLTAWGRSSSYVVVGQLDAGVPEAGSIDDAAVDDASIDTE